MSHVTQKNNFFRHLLDLLHGILSLKLRQVVQLLISFTVWSSGVRVADLYLLHLKSVPFFE